jgi:hypothetical protein
MTTRKNSSGRPSARGLALKQLATRPGTLIRTQDLHGATPMAAAQALSRLAREGVIQHIRKGVYYLPKQTLLGESRPSEAAILREVLRDKVRPTGITAANLLGLSTQISARPELAAYTSALPEETNAARIYRRRRSRATSLAPQDSALLEFLRNRGKFGELAAEETIAHLQNLLRPDSAGSTGARSPRLRHLRDAALLEPPRVRAMLGALMQSAGLLETLWRPLLESLNPQTRFDFGLLRSLPNAREWQAR